MKKVKRMSGRQAIEVTGWVCDVSARHELGETDVTVFPTVKAFKAAHPFHGECGGLVKLTISYEIKKHHKSRRS